MCPAEDAEGLAKPQIREKELAPDRMDQHPPPALTSDRDVNENQSFTVFSH